VFNLIVKEYLTDTGSTHGKLDNLKAQRKNIGPTGRNPAGTDLPDKLAESEKQKYLLPSPSLPSLDVVVLGASALCRFRFGCVADGRKNTFKQPASVVGKKTKKPKKDEDEDDEEWTQQKSNLSNVRELIFENMAASLSK